MRNIKISWSNIQILSKRKNSNNFSTHIFTAIFFRVFGEGFVETLFKIFDEQLSEVAKPLIVDAVRDFDAGKFLNHSENEADRMMSELFLKVKKFSDIGLSIVSKLDFETLMFFNWFSNDANHICECPVFSANARYWDLL